MVTFNIHIKRSHILLIILALVVFFGIRLASAWTNPTQAPPNGNVSLPSAQWTASGTVIYNSNSGNVGVGTANPATLFSVATSTNIFNVTAGGNVGIGTAAPNLYGRSTALTISAGTSGLRTGMLELQGSNTGAGGAVMGLAAFNTSTNIALVDFVTDTQGTDSGKIHFYTRPTGGSITSRMVIGSTGLVSVGTTTTDFYPLYVVGNNNYGALAVNQTRAVDDGDTRGIHVSLSGVASTATNPRFMVLYAGGVGVGRIRLNNGGVAYESGGVDFAEYFWRGEEQLEPGDIVAFDDQARVVRAVRNNEQSVVGVISEKGAFVGGMPASEMEERKKIVVGLVGQIETKISTANGPIKVGDFVGPSPLAGIGMKVTGLVPRVGIAMEPYAAEGVGKIRVLVRPY